MNELEENGLIERRRSAGTYVKKQMAKNHVRQLKSRNSNKIAVCVSRHFFYTRAGFEDIVGTFERELNLDNAEVLYLEFPTTEQGLKGFIKECAQSSIRALIIFPEQDEWVMLYYHAELFLEQPFNVLVFNRGLGESDSIPLNMAGFDMRQSGRVVSDWLLRHGINEIAICAFNHYNPNAYWMRERIKGVAIPLKVHQKQLRKFISESSEFDLDKIADFVTHAETCPALICLNDEAALLLRDNLTDAKGLEAGRDYILFGFDNHPAFRRDNILSAGWPLHEVGKVISAQIKELQEEKSDVQIKKIFRASIFQRGFNEEIINRNGGGK
jgi:DNA-binding LacI/PurR family transcriptional regulator